MINQIHLPTSNKLKHHQFIAKLTPTIRHIFEKLIILLMPIPLFMLFTGIEGLIEQESPENLASLGTIGSGFLNFLEMHSLIIIGALGITFIIWFLTRNIWSSPEHRSFENSNSEYSDEYEEFVDKDLLP